MKRLHLFLLVAAVGCSTQSEHETQPVSFAVQLAPLSPEEVADDSARLAALNSAMEASRIVGEALDRSATWRDAVQNTSALAAAHSEIRADVLQQTISATLLSKFLLPASTSAEKREAVRQAELLIEAESPESTLIANALESGREVVPTSELAALAERALATAEATSRSRAGCDGCDQAEVMKGLMQDAQAIGALRDLTRPSDDGL